MWRVSQAVKTLGFHPRNKGSTPLPATKEGIYSNSLIKKIGLWFFKDALFKCGSGGMADALGLGPSSSE